MRPQARPAPSLALKSSLRAAFCSSGVVRKLQPSSLNVPPKPSHFCKVVVSFTVTVAAEVDSVSAPSVFQYAPGAEVTSGGSGGAADPPPVPAPPAVGALPAVPGFEPPVPLPAPPLPYGTYVPPVLPALPLPVPALEPCAPAVFPGEPLL